MGKKILILGAGFGGLETATSLREQLNPEDKITVVDQKDYFTIGFSLLDVLVGKSQADEVAYGYEALSAKGIQFVKDRVVSIDPDGGRVVLSRQELRYDYLVVALGAELAPDATPGFSERGYHFYSLEGAARLHEKLDEFSEGTISLAILGLPYKCPPAPFEAAIKLDKYVRARGRRSSISLQVLIPGKIALPVAPDASERVEALLEEHNITLLREHLVTEVNSSNSAVTAQGTTVQSDLFIGVPVHRPPQVVRESPLGADGWIRVDPDNLQTRYPNVYAIGDCTAVPAGAGAVPKAGSFAEDAARSVAADIVAKERGTEFTRHFEAQGECFIELGDRQIASMQANFLGGAQPVVTVTEPSEERVAEKERFVSSRVERWLKK